MKRLAALFVLVAAFAVPLPALNLNGTTVVIPIIARFAGAEHSDWRTDLYLGNHSSVAKTITMTFYVAGGLPIAANVTVGQYAFVSVRDLIANTYGLQVASGQLVLTSSNTSSFEAWARIYNVAGEAGEFGQVVHGLPLLPSTSIREDLWLYGLSGADGNRTNVGIANPGEVEASVDVVLKDLNGTDLAAPRNVPVPPHATIQFDPFVLTGVTPRADVYVHLISIEDIPIYGYASVVRNDSNDASFLVATAPNQ